MHGVPRARWLVIRNASPIRTSAFSFASLRSFWAVAHWWERLLLSLSVFTILGGVVVGGYSLWISRSEIQPKHAGQYIEGFVGQPVHINPLYATSEVDQSLSALFYTGLLRTAPDGGVQLSLADSVAINDAGTEYQVFISPQATFHDGSPVTAADVVFTIRLIQDPLVRSPLRSVWSSVEVEARGEREVVFRLKSAYFGFPKLLTLGILPERIWRTTTPEQMERTELNTHPVGAGPVMFQELKTAKNGEVLSIRGEAFDQYRGGAPYLQRFLFKFFDSEALAKSALAAKDIDHFLPIIDRSEGVDSMLQMRSYGVFANPKPGSVLADTNMRKLLSEVLDRDALLDARNVRGAALFDPFLSENLVDPRPWVDSAKFAEELGKMGYKADGGKWKKDDKTLKLTLTTPDWPELYAVATAVAENYQKLGIEVELRALDASALRSALRTRDYDLLLYAVGMMTEPDMYGLWHSSEKSEGGQNLANFSTPELDKLVEDFRKTLSEADRGELEKKILTELRKYQPVWWLYSPVYEYLDRTPLLGRTVGRVGQLAERYADVERWYVTTTRVWK